MGPAFMSCDNDPLGNCQHDAIALYWSTIMRNLIERFVKCESGATAIEYGLMAAGISLAIMTAVATVGSNLASTFTSLETAVK
jgi:pilus assembly protein Flp/PilA